MIVEDGNLYPKEEELTEVLECGSPPKPPPNDLSSGGTQDDAPARKSLILAYLCYFTGGFAGLHLMYLERDYHALLHVLTFGGYYGAGTLLDLFLILSYTSTPSAYKRSLTQLQRDHFPRPPISPFIAFQQIIAGCMVRSMVQSALPAGTPWYLAAACLPLASSTAVWLTGRVKGTDGSFPRTLAWSYLYHLVHSLGLGSSLTLWGASPPLGALVGFTRSRRYGGGSLRIRAHRKKLYVGAIVLVLVLKGSYLYNNASVTLKGKDVPLREALSDFLSSEEWQRLQSQLTLLVAQARELGLRAALHALFAPTHTGMTVEEACVVLGVGEEAEVVEVKKRFRALTLEFHPDKQPPEAREEASSKFMVIRTAYDTLMNMKKKKMGRAEL